jgi:hypothetical protein
VDSGGDALAPRPAVRSLRIHCEECGAEILLPELSESDRFSLAELVRSGSLIGAIRHLRMGLGLGLFEAKILAEHVTLVSGVCNRCRLPLQGSGRVICAACRSVNFDW